jgi:glutaredoxin
MKSIVRFFFKALRVVLGPFVLLWEWLTRPKGIVRAPEAQAEVDRQCRGLALYQFRTCPFCIKVRQEMRRLSLDIQLLDAQPEGRHRADLLRGGGRAMVPCLRITDAAGNSEWMYESSAIIDYLRGRFSAD